MFPLRFCKFGKFEFQFKGDRLYISSFCVAAIVNLPLPSSAPGFCLRHGQMHKHLIQINESNLKRTTFSPESRANSQRNINFIRVREHPLSWLSSHRLLCIYCMSFEYLFYFLFLAIHCFLAICICAWKSFLGPKSTEHFVLMLFRFVPLEKTKEENAATAAKKPTNEKQICRWRNVVQFTHWIRSISSSISVSLTRHPAAFSILHLSFKSPHRPLPRLSFQRCDNLHTTLHFLWLSFVFASNSSFVFFPPSSSSFTSAVQLHTIVFSLRSRPT